MRRVLYVEEGADRSGGHTVEKGGRVQVRKATDIRSEEHCIQRRARTDHINFLASKANVGRLRWSTVSQRAFDSNDCDCTGKKDDLLWHRK